MVKPRDHALRRSFGMLQLLSQDQRPLALVVAAHSHLKAPVSWAYLDNVDDGVDPQVVQGWQKSGLNERLCLLHELVICYWVLLGEEVHRGCPKAGPHLQFGHDMHQVYLIALPAYSQLSLVI